MTNNRATSLATIAKLGQVCLHSMHKYVPRVHVQRLDVDETAGLDLSAKTLSAEQQAAAGIEQERQGRKEGREGKGFRYRNQMYRKRGASG